MRIGQDLCIALVLAVIGVGPGRPALARDSADETLQIIEDAMAGRDLTDTEAANVRTLIAIAQDRESAGDEDGAISALAEASAILKAV